MGLPVLNIERDVEPDASPPPVARFGSAFPAQSVLDAFPYYVLVLDDDHHILAANSVMCGALGCGPEALIGKDCPTVVHGTTGHFPGCPLDRALETGEAETREVYDPHSDRWLLSAVYPLAPKADGGRMWLHTALDITSKHESQRREQVALEQLRTALAATVGVIARAVEAKNPYTAGHQRRVAKLSASIAEELGLSKASIEAVRVAGSVHDLGKIGIPSEILNKPGPLTDEEFEQVKQHPTIGYTILEPADFPWPVAKSVLQHHERLDGSGYPAGLRGDAIEIESRVIAAADVVEAMSLARPYRPALGVDAALSELVAGRGIRYDANVVDACVTVFVDGFMLDEGKAGEA